MGGKQPKRGCEGGTSFPEAGGVKGTMAPAGRGVARGSGRKTSPWSHTPLPDLSNGALRVRAGNSCWLPRFRTIIKYLPGSHWVQREPHRAGTRAEFISISNCNRPRDQRGRDHYRIAQTHLPALLLPPHPLVSVQQLPGQQVERAESHAHTPPAPTRACMPSNVCVCTPALK